MCKINVIFENWSVGRFFFFIPSMCNTVPYWEMVFWFPWGYFLLCTNPIGRWLSLKIVDRPHDPVDIIKTLNYKNAQFSAAQPRIGATLCNKLADPVSIFYQWALWFTIHCCTYENFDMLSHFQNLAWVIVFNWTMYLRPKLSWRATCLFLINKYRLRKWGS